MQSPMTYPLPQPTAPGHSWVGIDLARLAQNMAALQARLAPETRLCAVLKADAYGAGIEHVAPALARAAIPFAAIASTAEALALRRAGYRGRVLRIRTATPQEAAEALGLGVEELVGAPEVAQRLSALALGAGITLTVHLALNAGGMARDGLELAAPGGPERARALLHRPGLRIAGIMTHFAEDGPDSMRAALATFRRETAWLIAAGGLARQDVLLHAANSSATLTLPETHLDMVRCGAALYGCIGAPPEFAPILSLCGRVAMVAEFPAGSTVGYDRTLRLTRDTRLANIPLGYANGYRRSFSNLGQVLIHGQRAPVMGKVSMNAVMADVTGIPQVQSGDMAVFFGPQGDDAITATEVEHISGRVLADLFCSWGRLNDRLCLQGGS